jgi:curved DNA-binding protein CbpA
MKNYYEILEVDKNASQEVIEKAYRALAKKYHPDLQQGTQKQEYAEKMKTINEAYDILSDNVKRAQYNQKLQYEQEVFVAEQQRIIQENRILKQQLNRMGNTQEADEGTIVNMSRILEQQIKAARQQAYHDAYVQDLNNRGYKIRYKHDLKYYLKLLITIAITILALFLLYQIPAVKNFFVNLYNESIVFQAIVDIFKNTFFVKF